MIIAEHGSWNRYKFQGARLMRITADPDGKNIKQVEFASGWIGADGKYLAGQTMCCSRRTAH